jgi:eukaryotic-like serine/threonine-protein kinase
MQMTTLGNQAARLTAAPPVIDRTYILHDQLGQGGMGAVYEAENRSNGERIALKLVSSEHPEADAQDETGMARRRLALAREFQTLASLHHPNVVRVLSYGFDRERGPYYTMELLRAPQTVVEAGAGRPLREKIHLLAQLLRALDYVHRRGIYHRDIKPNKDTPEAKRGGRCP